MILKKQLKIVQKELKNQKLKKDNFKKKIKIEEMNSSK